MEGTEGVRSLNLSAEAVPSGANLSAEAASDDAVSAPPPCDDAATAVRGGGGAPEKGEGETASGLGAVEHGGGGLGGGADVDLEELD